MPGEYGFMFRDPVFRHFTDRHDEIRTYVDYDGKEHSWIWPTWDKTTFHNALAYLEKGQGRRRRQGRGRQLNSVTTLLGCRVGDELAIGIQLWNTVVVAYLPDGREVLNCGSWRTKTTKECIQVYTSARLGQKVDLYGEGEGWVIEDRAAPTTPPRVQKCRSCRSAQKYGYTCSVCNGTGRADYGSKPIFLQFEDGIQLRDGVPVGFGPTPYVDYMSPEAIRAELNLHNDLLALKGRHAA